MGKMKNIPLLIGTVVVTLLLIVGVAVLFSNNSISGGQVTVDQTLLLKRATHRKGPETAPVTIVEFSDFQCPACRAAQPLVAQLLTQFPEDVSLVYRHFPLDAIHRNARLAAQAAEAASEYGKFWEYHDLLFENQLAWQDITNREELFAIFAEYAEQLAIDKTEFIAKIESDAVIERVQTDTAVAVQLGVSATPTFYVNGTRTSAPELRATVESVLQQVTTE